MTTFLAILVVIASILLTVVVLLQSGKDGGLATNFTAANQAFGVRQAGSVKDLLYSESLCHLVIRIHEPLSFTAEVGSACYLRDDRVKVADLRSVCDVTDESCADE